MLAFFGKTRIQRHTNKFERGVFVTGVPFFEKFKRNNNARNFSANNAEAISLLVFTIITPEV